VKGDGALRELLIGGLDDRVRRLQGGVDFRPEIGNFEQYSRQSPASSVDRFALFALSGYIRLSKRPMAISLFVFLLGVSRMVELCSNMTEAILEIY